MKNEDCCNDKWEEEVECEESGEGCVVYGKATPDSLDEGVSYIRYGREEVGNDRCTSE